MSAPVMSHERAKAVSSGVFLVGLGILLYTGAWWPEILLAIAASLGTKEFLRGRIYDLFLTLLIFIGLYYVFKIEGGFTFVVAVFLTLGGIYMIFRELFLPKEIKSSNDQVIDVTYEVKDETKKDE